MLKGYIRFFEPIRHLFILRTTGRVLGFIAALMTALFWKLSWAMMVFIVASVVSDAYFFLIKKLKESDFKAFETKCQALHFKVENYNKYALAITKVKVFIFLICISAVFTFFKDISLDGIFILTAVPYIFLMFILTPVIMVVMQASTISAHFNQHSIQTEYDVRDQVWYRQLTGIYSNPADH